MGVPVLDQIAKGRTDLVFDYVANGNSVRSTGPDGLSLIGWCSYFGDVSAIRFLLNEGEELASLGENFDLNGAAFHGHWRLCQFLLEQGADANYALPDTGETALHSAMSKPNRPAYTVVAQVLLASGANPNTPTIPGVETASFMRDARTRGETPLHRAAAFGDAEAIKFLREAGANPEARDTSGDTPLSWASWHTRPDEILRLLCYDKFTIHPERSSSFDHGMGWGEMERAILGTPQINRSK